MKNKFFLLALTTLFLLISCDNLNDILVPAGTGGEAIAFSLSDVCATTRAGFTASDTQIAMRIQSDERGGSRHRYTRTVAQAARDSQGDAGSYSTVTFDGGNTRYWNDAFGRDALLSVYAIAVPNKTGVQNQANTLEQLLAAGGASATWGENATNTLNWQVSTAQTTETLGNEDLVFSHNIQEDPALGKDGRYVWDYNTGKYAPEDTGAEGAHRDGRLQFTQKAGTPADGPGHFDRGHLKFQHALSKMTVKIGIAKDIEGHDYQFAAFQFKTGTNIHLYHLPYKGTFDIKTGKWSALTDADYQDFTKIASDKDDGVVNEASLSALMLPGYKFYKDGANGEKSVMRFIIDDNTYYISQKQVFDALKDRATLSTDGTYIEMQQGIHYILNINIGKKAIDYITATLAPWVEVTGKEMEVQNDHITFTLNTSGTACDKDIDLYRLADDNPDYDTHPDNFSYEGKNWNGNYTNTSATKTELLHSALVDGHWTTPWYYESNKTYYHFRTVNNGTTIQGNTDDTKDYFTISAGPVSTTDPHWGAPMKTSSTTWLKYDTEKGYEDHLSPALGASNSAINIQEVHVMSRVNVILKTTSGADAVVLQDGENTAEVKIIHIAGTGQVEMGRGLVTPASPYTAQHTMDVPATYYKTDKLETNAFSYAVVPQALSRNFSSEDENDYVGISIKTPDGNTYLIVKKLSEILAASVTDGRDQTKDQAIKRWFPGHTYTYTFTLSKKGIANITAQVADWVDVVAADTKLDLEN